MSTTSLTAKYRPQRFADVAGQDAIKRILSRAAAEDKIAPAYLFSGTRGVGKTTLARVLAKALNCESAPTAEPCNVCSQCRQITAGVSPDVIEIDAATHGKVEDARKLKEDVGYAPLQSRYKVFIIDEAHMLSTAAFNALLKTLEEPPARVTFILATTEAHKFPATIISRCQHFLFKRLAQPELEVHLAGVLDREAIHYESTAVSLIARRGAGSVRDSMSLLGQVLALGGAELTEADARGVLGLAGQDIFFGLIEAIHAQDGPAVVELLRQVLEKGLDIGFFLRELAGMWRNLFLLRQAGQKGLSVVDLPAEDSGLWLDWAGKFDAAHIHACWQMTLEGQRRVLTSLEPALSLELLLLNMAYLPNLLPLQNLASCSVPPERSAGSAPGGAPASGTSPRSPAGPGTPYGAQSHGGHPQGSSRPAPRRFAPSPSTPAPGASTGTAAPPPHGQGGYAARQSPSAAGHAAVAEHPAPPQSATAAPSGPRNWDGFKRFAMKSGEISGLKQARGEFVPDPEPGQVRILCTNAFHRSQLSHPDKLRQLDALAAQYFGPGVAVRVDTAEPDTGRMSGETLSAYIDSRPEVRQAVSDFDAEIIERKPR
ncbi:DNA polymerase III, subunits gamma and tau [Solidesulfovibrio fructosivorans JJ]]|uniref:DNA polymerase III subunit gamma/tau n=1 Tax=Solidesulfovibrio fructosivorans JJ] TaxID=596151 RepID=E1JQW0_SOLFR|nr:DNA polymerase III subunit gamma/tau [Solidesulfovibrio fructosivorans]EFL52961.1 DNA polymerase III, subunits gamma and tau [Solidesulfovibrio fructosivorans JJ]]